MPQKKHKPEEIVAKLRQVDVLVSQGRPVAEAVRSIGVTQFTYYRWRKEFGGLKTDQVKRLKELEKENERLRKAVSDLTIEKLILREAASGETSEPRPSPPLHRACKAEVPGFGAPRLPCFRTASLHPAEGAARTSRRGCAHGGHHRPRQSVWPLWLPTDRGDAARCGLGGEHQACRADMATGGAEGSPEATKEGPSLAQRRVLHPSPARTAEPCLVLRLRREPDP